MICRSLCIGCAFACALTYAVVAEDVVSDPTAEKAKIEFLLKAIIESKLTFIRNDEQCDAVKAAEHLRTKWNATGNEVKTARQDQQMQTSKTDIKDCVNVITEINEYSKLYFSTEEKYLKKKGYPDFNSHAKAHRQFAKISISLRLEVSENEASLTFDVIEEMRNWLINHILTLDSRYIPFLRINQYIEAAKKKN